MKDSDAIRPDGGLPAASRTALRGPAVRRLLALRAAKKLTAVHVRVAADALGVSERTVWRWLATAQRGLPSREPGPSPQRQITAERPVQRRHAGPVHGGPPARSPSTAPTVHGSRA
ncbi:helix-turn-helix domain-containing protein [Streptomyces sp. 1222.5]|uniref:helix-turn-helix domain-containing protein n=1 Tax=Streptomyces sp. 1222.5 TaxID=1881026 RepID=UPI003D740133